MSYLFTILIALSFVSCMPSFNKTKVDFDDGTVLVNPQIPEVIDFNFLKNKILLPKGCINCHASFADPVKLRRRIVVGVPEESELFDWVVDGRMPEGGAPLTTYELDIVRGYINSLVK